MKLKISYLAVGAATLALFSGSQRCFVSAHDDDDDHEDGEEDHEDDGFEGVQDCDIANKNFTESFYSGKIDFENLNALPIFEFIDCNHTHFTVSVGEELETYPLSIYEYNECPDDDHHHDDDDDEDHHHEDRRLTNAHRNPLARLLHDDAEINCYYALCATEEELEGIDSGGDHHGDDDEEEEEEHEHDRRRRLAGNYQVIGRSRSNGKGRGLHDDVKILVTAHVNLCCEFANETVRAVPHHYCSVPEFFEALAEGDIETTEPKAKGRDLTLPVAIGGVAAFAALLVAVAWLAPSTEKTKDDAAEKAAEVKAKGKQLEEQNATADAATPVAIEVK